MVLNNPNVITNLHVKKNLLSSRNVNNPSYKDNQVNIPINKFFTFTSNSSPYDYSLTSNTMINCDNTNVINLSFRRTDTPLQSLAIGVYYNQINNIDTAELIYQTEQNIDNNNFFNQFPKRNKFIYFKALNVLSNVNIIGQVELSKYTQFTTNAQIRDTIDINSQSNLIRNTNDYFADVIEGKIKGESLIRRSGFLNNYPIDAGETIIGTGEIFEPSIWSVVGPTGEDFVNVYSDFAGDNTQIVVKGFDSTANTVFDFMTLSGTSNITSLKKFKVIDFISIGVVDQPVGNIFVQTVTNGELLNRISAGHTEVDNIIITVPTKHESVIKNLSINSLIDLRGSEIRLNKRRIVSTYTQKSIIQSWKIEDQTFNISLDLIGDAIFGGEFIYVSIIHPGYNALYSNYINCSLEIVQRQLSEIYEV
tara:strand:+ start:1594 stop:2856 length:1263 start_codon:yes stop_codon:yes gene_type:complete